jgi:hypothetical protein
MTTRLSAHHRLCHNEKIYHASYVREESVAFARRLSGLKEDMKKLGIGSLLSALLLVNAHLAWATPPYTLENNFGYDPETYDGHKIDGLGTDFFPDPRNPQDWRGFRGYIFRDASNSYGFWQDGDMKDMLACDRALGIACPKVFFFSSHGRLWGNQKDALGNIAGLSDPSTRYAFAATCNDNGRGPHHAATVLAQASNKITFGINPNISSSLEVKMVDGYPTLYVTSIMPDGITDGPLIGKGTKANPTWVAVKPDGTVIGVPHPERVPQLAGIKFAFAEPEGAVENSSVAPVAARRCGPDSVVRGSRSQNSRLLGNLGRTAGGNTGRTATAMLGTLAVNTYLENLANAGNQSARDIVEGQAYHAKIVSNLERGLSADGERLSWWEGWLNALGASAPPN